MNLTEQDIRYLIDADISGLSDKESREYLLNKNYLGYDERECLVMTREGHDALDYIYINQLDESHDYFMSILNTAKTLDWSIISHKQNLKNRFDDLYSHKGTWKFYK